MVRYLPLRYVETMKEMVSGKENKVVYMPYETSGVLSSECLHNRLSFDPSANLRQAYSKYCQGASSLPYLPYKQKGEANMHYNNLQNYISL
jgi:hypothetical protein